jgi:hypothetical protein
VGLGMAGVFCRICGQVRLTPGILPTMNCFLLLPRVLSALCCQVQNCRDLGATVHLQGAHIGEARDIANAIATEHGLTYINGFDHPHIIAGAGTMVLCFAQGTSQYRGGVPASACGVSYFSSCAVCAYLLGVWRLSPFMSPRLVLVLRPPLPPSPTSPCQGLEIIEQVPDVEAVVVPVGGGGLIAGVALAVKTLKPDVIVIVS